MERLESTQSWSPDDTTEDAATAPSATLTPGTFVADRYRITRCIGRGGFGTVYAARDEQLDADVAIKVMRPHLVDAVAERRLRREVLVGRDVPTGCVRVHHMDWWNGLPYLVLERIDGCSLKDMARRDAPMTESEVIRVGRELAVTLARLHRRGVVHRDVKPGNVLLADDGRVLLCDLGLAAVRESEAVTATGVVVGTPGFVAPEQWSGVRVTGKADVYALGRTLQACLGAEEGEADVVGGGDWRVPAATTARWLRRLLTHMTDADPRRRPSAAAVARSLERRWTPLRLAVAGRWMLAAAAVGFTVAVAALAAARSGWLGAGRPDALATLEQLRADVEPIASPQMLRQVGEVTLGYLESLSADAHGDEQQLAWVDANRLIGDGLLRDNLVDDAERHYLGALKVAVRHAAARPLTSPWNVRAWRLRSRVAEVAAKRGQHTAAYGMTLHIHRAVRSIQQQSQESMAWSVLLAEITTHLAYRASTIGNEVESLRRFHQAVALWDRQQESEPSPRWARYTVNIRGTLADEYAKQRDMDAARRYLDDGQGLAEAYLRRYPRDTGLLSARSLLITVEALIAFDRGERERAFQLGGEAVDILEAVVEREPDNAYLLDLLASHLSKQAWMYEAGGRPKLASAARVRQDSIREKLVTGNPDSVRRRMDKLYLSTSRAYSLLVDGDPAAALEEWRQARAEVGMPDPGELSTPSLLRHASLFQELEGRILIGLGRCSEAVDVMQQGVLLAERAHVEVPTDRIMTARLAQRLSRYAMAASCAGHEATATSAAARAVHIADGLYREHPAWTNGVYTMALALIARGEALHVSGSSGEAAAAWRRALEVLEPQVADPDQLRSWDLELLALLHLHLREVSQGASVLKVLQERNFVSPEVARLARLRGLEPFPGIEGTPQPQDHSG